VPGKARAAALWKRRWRLDLIVVDFRRALSLNFASEQDFNFWRSLFQNNNSINGECSSSPAAVNEQPEDLRCISRRQPLPSSLRRRNTTRTRTRSPLSSATATPPPSANCLLSPELLPSSSSALLRTFSSSSTSSARSANKISVNTKSNGSSGKMKDKRGKAAMMVHSPSMMMLSSSSPSRSATKTLDISRVINDLRNILETADTATTIAATTATTHYGLGSSSGQSTASTVVLSPGMPLRRTRTPLSSSSSSIFSPCNSSNNYMSNSNAGASSSYSSTNTSLDLSAIIEELQNDAKLAANLQNIMIVNSKDNAKGNSDDTSNKENNSGSSAAANGKTKTISFQASTSSSSSLLQPKSTPQQQQKEKQQQQREQELKHKEWHAILNKAKLRPPSRLTSSQKFKLLSKADMSVAALVSSRNSATLEIYLSPSSCDDFDLEKAFLTSDVYPYLRKFAKSLNLDVPYPIIDIFQCLLIISYITS
jgi:hypothetical protein